MVEKHVDCELSQNDEGLDSVIRAWSSLQPSVQDEIDLIVRSASSQYVLVTGNTEPTVQRPTSEIFSIPTASTESLGKTILFLLRHSPEAGNLLMNGDGWIDLRELQSLLRHNNALGVPKGPTWLADFLPQSTIHDRIEIRNGQIRALYGHSSATFNPSSKALPSECLFHGTSMANVPLINASGLIPGKRRFVQLTTDHDYAANVRGRAFGDSTVVYQVMTSTAIDCGVEFYQTGSDVWLATRIPPHCLQLWMDHAPTEEDYFVSVSEFIDNYQLGRNT